MRFNQEELLYEVRGPKGLFEMTMTELKEEITQTEIVLVSCASTEPHGPHLPLGSDTLQGSYLLRKVWARLREFGIKCVIGPVVPFGIATNRFERSQPWLGNLYLSPSTYRKLLHEICLRLVEMGLRKIVLVVNHVENDSVMQTVAKELADDQKAQVIVTNGFKYTRSHYGRILRSTQKDSHGGEAETARVMACAPGLVDTAEIKPYHPGPVSEVPIEEDVLPYLGGCVGVYFPWGNQTENPGYVGDPGLATVEVGEKTYDVMADWIARVTKKYLT
jgi:creatinine amidohydrolase